MKSQTVLTIVTGSYIYPRCPWSGVEFSTVKADWLEEAGTLEQSSFLFCVFFFPPLDCCEAQR